MKDTQRSSLCPSSRGAASFPSQASTFFTLIPCFKSSSALLPLIKSPKNPEKFDSSNDAFIVDIFDLDTETATTAGKPNPKLSDLSKSN